MSTGRIHDHLSRKIILPTAVLVGVGVFPLVGLNGSVLGAFCAILGVNLQRLCTPDMDVDNGNFSLFLAKMWFGDIIGELWKYYWRLYALIIPHRHWISHFPIISTLIRFLYLLPIISPFYKYFLINYDILIYILIGMVIGDLGHILLDFRPSLRTWYESTVDR